MPLYEYECSKCKVYSEELQPRVSGNGPEKLVICKCCGGRMHKIFSVVGKMSKNWEAWRNDG